MAIFLSYTCNIFFPVSGKFFLFVVIVEVS